MSKAARWDKAHWVKHFVKKWDFVSPLLGSHPKLHQARRPENFLACSECHEFFTAQEPHTCPQCGSLYSLKEAARGDESARSAFVQAWLKTAWSSLPCGLRPRGPAKKIPAQFMKEFRQSLLYNADDLIDESILLFDNMRYPRAGFLALVAQEELVKMAWASIADQNRNSYFYQFPMEGCKPGFVFPRFYLALRGLRLICHSSFDHQFKCEADYDMLDHDSKLAIVKSPREIAMLSHYSPILTVTHVQKYSEVYAKIDRLPERCRYVDLNFDHAKLGRPEQAMTREHAYDQILFASALCHDWAAHGLCAQSGNVWNAGEFDRFRKRARQRYDKFLKGHQIKSEIFPKPT